MEKKAPCWHVGVAQCRLRKYPPWSGAPRYRRTSRKLVLAKPVKITKNHWNAWENDTIGFRKNTHNCFCSQSVSNKKQNCVEFKKKKHFREKIISKKTRKAWTYLELLLSTGDVLSRHLRHFGGSNSTPRPREWVFISTNSRSCTADIALIVAVHFLSFLRKIDVCNDSKNPRNVDKKTFLLKMKMRVRQKTKYQKRITTKHFGILNLKSSQVKSGVFSSTRNRFIPGGRSNPKSIDLLKTRKKRFFDAFFKTKSQGMC